MKNQLGLEALEQRTVLSGTPINLDINPFGPSYPTEFTEVGDVTYFVADDGTNGRELWKIDSAGETSLVADLRSGAGSSFPTELVNVDGTLFFAADDGNVGLELWKIDAGATTPTLVRDIGPGVTTDTSGGTTPNSSTPLNLTNVNGTLFFTADDGVSGRELWASDGTTAGTRLVRNIFTGEVPVTGEPFSSDPAYLTNVDGTLFFTAADADNGRELWKSDGTAVGTVMVKDLFEGTYAYYLDDEDNTYVGQYPNNSSPGLLTALDGVLYFVASNEDSGAELWRSDGTEAGTHIVKEIVDGADGAFTNLDSIVAAGDLLFFTADDGEHGSELWKSDGTEAGTVMVKDLRPGAAGRLNYYTALTAVGDKVYFAGNDGVNGRELWVSDGTDSGTQMVADINPGQSPAGAINHSYPAYLQEVEGKLYFSAVNSAVGRELWVYDPGADAVELVEDRIEGVGGSYPNNLAGVNGRLYYSSEEDSARELWTVVPEDDFQLTIVVDSQFVDLPGMIGVDATGQAGDVYTWADGGQVLFDAGAGVTLGDFFDTWRTAGGQAGDNADSELSRTNLLGNLVDADNTLQMFVNGQLVSSYDQYVVQDEDDIVLVYGQNPVVSLNTNFGSIVIELYESDTPGTVQNFLNYVNDGDYLDTFFHRSVENFVIQGGGFSTTSPTFTDVSQFSAIATDATIDNEPGISNLRGTIAMAKLGGDPDSATSQFFINLGDNSGLDSAANNAFTVFGQVLGMTTVDEIASHPIDTSNSSPYGELPLTPDGTLTVIESIGGGGEVAGIAYLDADLDGQQDAGEGAISGATIYVDANDNGVLDDGESFTITDTAGAYRLLAAPGDQVVRADFSTAGFTSDIEGKTLSVRIGETLSGVAFAAQVLTAPAGVDLAAASDTGVADDDNLTRLNNGTAAGALTFQVTGVTPGAEVRIYADGALIGSTTAAGATVDVVTDGSAVLSNGQHAITATQVLGSLESDPTAALTVEVDAAAPGAITSAFPQTISLDNQPLSHDVQSPDEGQAGVVYSLQNAPDGMTIDASTGQVSWAADNDDVGTHDFTIVVSDQAGNSSETPVSLTVLAAAPAFPDNYATIEDVPLVVQAGQGVLVNDGDNDSNVTVATLVTGPAHGSITLNDDGSFTYTPDDDFNGEDSFTYQGTAGDETTNVARVTIAVSSVADEPDGVADAYQVDEDGVLQVGVGQGVLANDSDADLDPLTAGLVDGPAHGSISFNDDGSFTYTPDDDFFGSDSFTYAVSDQSFTTDPITVDLTVNSVNDAPTAADDAFAVDEDGVLTVLAAGGVLLNDADVEGAVTAVLKSGPTSGSLMLNDDGSFSYTPDDDFFGTDSFTYAASDGDLESAAATVTITVNGTPDDPTANADAVTAPNDATAQTLDLLGNDTTDPDGDQSLAITSVTQGAQGGVVTLSGGVVTYAAVDGYLGQDTFTYTVTDADGLTSTATVTVTVEEAANNVLTGFVYIDANGNGQRDDGEMGVAGIDITLAGAPNNGAAVDVTVQTDADGAYAFEDIAAGTYSLTQHGSAALVDGDEETTVTGATVGDDVISSIVLSGGVTFDENNFGERAVAAQYQSIRWLFASSTDQQALLGDSLDAAESNAASAAAAAQAPSANAQTINDSVPSAAIAADAASLTQQATPAAYLATVDRPLEVPASEGLLPESAEAGAVVQLVVEPEHGEVEVQPDGAFRYTPATGFLGEDAFTYRVVLPAGGATLYEASISVSSPAAEAFALLADEPEEEILVDLPSPEIDGPDEAAAVDMALALAVLGVG